MLANKHQDASNTNAFSKIEQLYRVREPEEALRFIEQHSDLMQPLSHAPDEVRRYFPDAKLGLRVFNDMETTGYTHLIIMISSVFSPKETLSRLDQFNEAWGYDLTDQTQGKITFNVEFE